MMSGDNGKFEVEVLEWGYESCLPYGWPIKVRPLSYELLSSWLHAAALANGVSLPQLGKALGVRNFPALRQVDHACPDWLIHSLSHQTGLTPQALYGLMMQDWLMPLALNVPHAGNQREPGWLQFCPACWFKDERPYFRRSWRLATLLHCGIHHTALRDNCPLCMAPVGIPEGEEIHSVHLCRQCGCNLRFAPVDRLGLPASRLSHSIKALVDFNATVVETSSWQGRSSCMLDSVRLREQLLQLPGRAGRLTTMSWDARRALYHRRGQRRRPILTLPMSTPPLPWQLHLRHLFESHGRTSDSDDSWPRPKAPVHREAKPCRPRNIYDLLNAYREFVVGQKDLET